MVEFAYLMMREGGQADHGELSDRQLIAAILRGEQQQVAWDILLTRYSRLVYTVPRRYGLQESDAADVYQAVCEALWKDLGALRDVERLTPWLLRVAGRLSWRAVMDRRRQAQRESSAPVVDDLLSDPAPRPEEALLDRENRGVVAAAVAALPERCRQLVWHLYYDPAHPSYDEIARSMGLAEGSVGPIRGRCLAQLKKRLRGEDL